MENNNKYNGIGKKKDKENNETSVSKNLSNSVKRKSVAQTMLRLFKPQGTMVFKVRICSAGKLTFISLYVLLELFSYLSII